MTFSIWELRRQFGSVATLYPYATGPVLTFTTFGSCLSDNVEVPCSTALGRVFDEGWKSWSDGRDAEMMGILEMMRWLRVLYWILQVLLLFACCAVVSREREKKRYRMSSGGNSPWGERYRRAAIVLMAFSTCTLMITTYIGLQLSPRLSATLLGSIDYPSLHISIIGVFGFLYGTLRFYFRDRGDPPLNLSDTTDMDKIG